MLKLRNGGHKELERYYSLMEMDFDSEELFPKLTIHKAMMQGNLELLILEDDESKMDLAYALVMPKSLYGYVLLKYMAVLPWFRGKGVGVELMRQLNKRYAEKQGILAELTEFDDPEPDHLKKLFKFFARFGYVEAKSDYRIGGAAAHLMVKPIKGPVEIEPVEHRMINDFYSRCLSYNQQSKMIDIRPVRG